MPTFRRTVPALLAAAATLSLAPLAPAGAAPAHSARGAVIPHTSCPKGGKRVATPAAPQPLSGTAGTTFFAELLPGPTLRRFGVTDDGAATSVQDTPLPTLLKGAEPLGFDKLGVLALIDGNAAVRVDLGPTRYTCAALGDKSANAVTAGNRGVVASPDAGDNRCGFPDTTDPRYVPADLPCGGFVASPDAIHAIQGVQQHAGGVVGVNIFDLRAGTVRELHVGSAPEGTFVENATVAYSRDGGAVAVSIDLGTKLAPGYRQVLVKPVGSGPSRTLYLQGEVIGWTHDEKGLIVADVRTGALSIRPFKGHALLPVHARTVRLSTRTGIQLQS